MYYYKNGHTSWDCMIPLHFLLADFLVAYGAEKARNGCNSRHTFWIRCILKASPLAAG
nr:MAG TPA: hypothetical protein [Caudoviricetes sp.]